MFKTFNASLTAFTSWLGATPLSAFVAGAAWVVPAVQTIHILAVALTMGAVAIIDLRVLGLVDAGQPVSSVLDRFLPTIGAALVVLALTGAVLISGEPTRAIFRTIFWVKLGLIVAAAALTWSLRPATRSASAGGAVPAPAKVIAGASLLLWLAVVVAGRWIGYAVGWPGSPQ